MKKRLVVSDTMIISYLIQVRHEFIFSCLNFDIVIPTGVKVELNRTHPDLKPYAQWLRVVSVKNRRLVQQIEQRTIIDRGGQPRKMNLGEAECVALYRELPGAELLLCDDYVCWKLYHEELGPSFVRLGKLLLLAKEQGAIQSVIRIIRLLQKDTTYRMKENVVMQLAHMADEV